MRVLGWLLGSLFLLIGLGSLGMAVVYAYAVADGAASPTMKCVQTEGLLDCNGTTSVDGQLGSLAYGVTYGFVGVSGVVGGTVLMGAAMVAGSRRPTGGGPAGGQPVGPGHHAQAYPQHQPQQRAGGPY